MTKQAAPSADPKQAEFELWIAAVDHHVRRNYAISLHDLPDTLTRDGFDSGETPESYFRETIIPLVIQEFGGAGALLFVDAA